MTFEGGGELGAMMHDHDWSTSPIGDPDTWPQALRSAVSMMLPSKHVMFVAWGPELAFLYNDACRPVLLFCRLQRYHAPNRIRQIVGYN